MFAAILGYQLVNLLIAAALAALLLRGTAAAWTAALARRFPRALATPFRTLVLVTFPVFLLLTLAAALLGELFAFRWVDHLAAGHPGLQRAANLGLFLVLGVAFAGMAVVFPLLAAWGAWRAPGVPGATAARRRADRRLAGALVVVSTSVAAWCTLVEPRRIVVEEVDVSLPGWPSHRDPLRVVLLADFQSARLSDHERRVPDLVAALRPDLIVVAGDLVSHCLDESLTLEQARYILTRLSAPLGVFVVNGDVDDVVEGGIRRTLEGMPARLLDNESVVVPSDPPVEIGGFDPRRREKYEAALRRPALASHRIGLVHRPRHQREIGSAGYPLVLAGHTHGGQVVLPGFGPIVTLEVVSRAVAGGGLHPMERGTQIYVSRGLGLEGGFAPPIRLFCPPEITLLRVGPGPNAAVAASAR